MDNVTFTITLMRGETLIGQEAGSLEPGIDPRAVERAMTSSTWTLVDDYAASLGSGAPSSTVASHSTD